MSNSRSFRRSLKQAGHVRPSGQVQHPGQSGKYAKGHVPWNRGLALTTTPTIGTVRRWCEACAAEGWIERKGVERTGKPGRPAVIWGLTKAGWDRAKVNPAAPPEVRKMEWERSRRVEIARKQRGTQRLRRRLRAAQDKADRSGRRLTVAEDAFRRAEEEAEEARARLLTAEIIIRATKAMIDSDGDASVLLPEERDALLETGCAIEQDGRLLASQEWLEAYSRIMEAA